MAILEKGPNVDVSVLAGEKMAGDDEYDDSAYINKVVCLNSDNEAVYPTAITDIPFGILIKGNLEGYPVTVRRFGIAPVKVGAALTLPNILGIGSDGGTIDGRVKAAVATNYPVGDLMEASDAEDDIVTMFVNISGVAKA